MSGLLGRVPECCPTQRHLLNGLENAARQKAENVEKKSAITYNILKKLNRRTDKKKWRMHSKITVKAFCCAAYFGSFRAGELLPKHTREYDPVSDLRWKDVNYRYDAEGQLSSVVIHVRMPKTKTAGGELVELFRFGDADFYPVRNLRELEKSQKRCGVWERNRPVFRFNQRQNLSVKTATEIIVV